MAAILSLRALVTGATSGIGRAVAVKLAADGFEVIVHGRDAGRGAQTVEEIERSGGKARFLAADLGNPAEIRRLAEQVGDIDVLVNNAGFSAWGPTAELDVATFDGMFTANVRAPSLSRRRVRAGDGSPWEGQHHQHQQHGGPSRPTRRCGLRGHQGRPGLLDARMDR